ncbi:hypothetical protein RJ639_043419 [Escallonia herrerae]|uniref:RRM domain-containing protein n=1 Tax=Escallonia herrerae TaxID=1293975 RepID=A0AA89B3A6_9ASTE|nr:hypothetical protein RJ639_043419 [Escallonia herrerae]
MAAIRRLLPKSILGHFSQSNPAFVSSPSNVYNPPSFRLVARRGLASKLFVTGLSFYTTENGLSQAFSQYGQVVQATIVMDKVSDRSKGFGFVTFASADEAEKALTEMNGQTLDGRVVFVQHAKSRRSTMRFGDGMPIARGPPEPSEER